jgi:hypothetical protein
MQSANKERWQELCAQAANEQNPEKLSALIAEIDRLLGEKYDRLSQPGGNSEIKKP